MLTTREPQAGVAAMSQPDTELAYVSRIAKSTATGTSNGLTIDGGCEMDIFSGSRARERAIIFGERWPSGVRASRQDRCCTGCAGRRK